MGHLSRQFTFAQSTSVGATETLALSTSAGVTQYAYNAANELVEVNSGGAVAFQGTTNKPVKSVAVPAVNISSVEAPSYIATTNAYPDDNNSYTVCQGLTTTITLAGFYSCCQHVLTITSPQLSGGEMQLTVSGNYVTDVITNFAAAINSSSALTAIGVSATAAANVLTIVDRPTYTASTSVGATETIVLSKTLKGNVTATLGGTPTVGDTVSIVASSNAFTGGTETISYAVVSGDTLASIATHLASLISADTKLIAVGLSAAANTASLNTTKSFTANLTLPSGSSKLAVSATDGGSNTVTNNHQLSVSGPASSTSCYDTNGNLLNDGTNTYAAE